MIKAIPVHYLIEAANVHAHLWRVTLTVAKPARLQTVSLPVWIPGSYMVREFSKHVQNLSASQDGKACAAEQLDKCTWRIKSSTAKPLVISYEVYAFDNSVRTAWLDAQRAFFNPTSLCLRVEGQEEKEHGLSLNAINSEALCAVFTPAKPLKPSKKASHKLLGEYVFEDYDHLADTPFEIGSDQQCWHGSFTLRGVKHEFVVSGAPASFDGARLLADTKKIVEAELQFWHGKDAQPPFDRYVFMLNAVDDGYGGLEHRASTALICSRRDLPRIGMTKPSEGYTTLLGLISHEYFHTWNVKRLKPQEFLPYDYAQESYTQMLWFFEGFTSYYDDLILRRAGLIDQTQYLRLLSKAINQVQQTPGRKVQSVAQASMDAWVKYYRQDENTPNATVSYYTKGSLVGLCFDLSLRKGGKGSKTTSLDEVMRLLWKQSKASEKGQGGITEADFAAALQQLSGRSYAKEIAAWVHGTGDLPLQELLEAHGVSMTAEPGASLPMAQRLGLRVSESSGSLIIKNVLTGGLAQQAGFAPGDEWLAVDDWRIHKLEDLALLCGNAANTTATVSRDKRLLRLQLTLPGASTEPSSSCMLRSTKDEPLSAWLLG
ncbi:PDZ domain-containing protein [Variovorax sp. PCZ-1]|uniref:M61 family metallopeptidase n=1 Tax=Variovorax sp. PCZ-1 TaxID=2835533 RepID=UPI001BD166E6|nr:PDZ domain-containing protein [Variovorax sp. PCZ-1]MBS7808051.1 M61 family metallopeptidase [Variovorax sp. PCZ-1]